MTDRLYYADSYTRVFSASITERLNLAGRPAVVLDRTYFYPASGGQPFDLGTLSGVPVVEVAVRPDDGAVVHVLERELEGSVAQGEINWPRRFDHMQQHTGQHILSQAFLRVAEAETVGFHLTENSVTIDLAGALEAGTLRAAEAMANQVVTGDLLVRAWFPEADELEALALRRTPEGLAPGALRVVAIGDFDLNACGGTHVAHTGEIGLIKIINIETLKRNVSGKQNLSTRVEFRCGLRALDDYRLKNDLVNALAAEFTCGPDEVQAAVGRLRAEAQASHRALKTAQQALLEHEAVALAGAARAVNGWRVVRRAWPERDAAELRGLAARLAAQPDTIALLGSGGDKSQMVFARAEGLALDMRQALTGALATLGTGRGGGSPALAQGGGAPAGLAQVEAALEQVERSLVETPV